MLFTSQVFIFVFLPTFLVLYFVVPGRVGKNLVLLIASLGFYAWGEPLYVLLMVASILVNWVFGIMLSVRSQGFRRMVLLLAVITNIAVISFFKYEAFLAENINAIVGSGMIPRLDLPLPIGISFYTLQVLSYVIDVYRQDTQPQRNPFYLGMYVTCFPQLIAGPIVRYSTIEEQIVNRQESLEGFASGMRLFIVGLAKKALLADNLAILADKMLSMGGPAIGAVGAWSGLLAYTFQILFDFSGYSDMALGLGRMMGFEYQRNFNYPYISKSITEFWHRWHMSLSSFFRDYVYIPLGGSRVSPWRNVANIAVVWALTGLWHGAAWNYILWGVYYGLLLICEKYVWGKRLVQLPAMLRHAYCIIVFVFGWSFFWITDSVQLIPYWKALLGQYGVTGLSKFWELTAWEYIPLFVTSVVAATPICPYLKYLVLNREHRIDVHSFVVNSIVNERHTSSRELFAFDIGSVPSTRRDKVCIVRGLRDVALLVLLVACCAKIVSGSFSPFIYFQF